MGCAANFLAFPRKFSPLFRVPPATPYCVCTVLAQTFEAEKSPKMKMPPAHWRPIRCCRQEQDKQKGGEAVNGDGGAATAAARLHHPRDSRAEGPFRRLRVDAAVG